MRKRVLWDLLACIVGLLNLIPLALLEVPLRLGYLLRWLIVGVSMLMVIGLTKLTRGIMVLQVRLAEYTYNLLTDETPDSTPTT